jgi:hypothetical protein
MKLSPKAQLSINKVVDKFKTGSLSPIKTVTRITLDSSAPSNNWSLSNKVLAFIQSNELDCRGFKQWQKVGRQVEKGSRAVYILRPHMIKPDENEDKSTCIGFSPIAVFPASVTSGETNLPSYLPIKLPPLFEIAQKFNISVKYLPVSPDKLGDCDINGSNINLGSHDERIFFHELSHAIHARIDGKLKGGQQLDQETIAEFTTTVLMDFYDLGDHTGNAWKYIKQYSNDPLTAITKALGTVEKVLEVLLC